MNCEKCKIKGFLWGFIRKMKGWESCPPKLLFKHKGEFSPTAADALFKSNEVLISQIRTFCAGNGHSIDRVSIVQCDEYDLRTAHDGVKSESNCYIDIIEHDDGLVEARVYMDNKMEIS